MADRNGVDFKITAQDAATQVFKSVEQALHNLEGTYRSVAGTGKLLAGAFGLHEIIEGVDKVVEKGVEWEAANNRIIGILKATGSSAGVTKREIEEMAEAYSKSSLADDDAIKGVAATLLKFGNIQEDVFKRAVRDSLDLAGVMGNDFPGAAQKLGQALANPLEGLKGLQQEIGKLNPAEKQAIENLVRQGDLLGAQERILKLVEARVGGLAQQLDQGLTKSTKDASKAWDDLLKAVARTESFKSSTEGFFDTLTHGLEKTKGLVEGGWFDRLETIGKFANPLTALPTASGLIADRIFGKKLSKSTNTTGDRDDAEAGQDREALNASTAADTKREEERRALLLANAQKMAGAELGAIRSRAQGVVDAEKSLGESRLKVLDLYNEKGLISIKDFYGTRRTIDEETTRAEIEAIDKSVAAQEKQKAFLKEPQERLSAQTQIDEQLRKRQQLVNNLGTSAVTATLQQQKAEEDLRDVMIQVNNEIARSEGRLAAAAAGEETLRTRKLREQLKLPDNAAALDALGIPEPLASGALGKLKDLKVLTAQFQEQQVQGAGILDTISAKEASIEAQRKQGAITDIEALRQTGAAHGEQLERLRQIGEVMVEVSRQMANPQLAAQAEQFKAKIDDLAASVDLLGIRARTTFEEGLTGFLDAAIGRTKSLKDAFKDMVTDIGRQLLHLENQQIAQGILGKSGAGGLFADGGLFGNILKLFGGGSDSPQPLGFSPEQLIRLDGSRAGGGDVAAGDTYLVGEKGPEVVKFGRSGTVFANDQLGVAAPTVNVTQHIHVDSRSDIGSVMMAMRTAKDAAVREVFDAIRRGGTARSTVRG